MSKVRERVRARGVLSDPEATNEEREAARAILGPDAAIAEPQSAAELPPVLVETHDLIEARKAVATALAKYNDLDYWATPSTDEVVHVITYPSEDGVHLIVAGTIVMKKQPHKIMLGEQGYSRALDAYLAQVPNPEQFKAERERMIGRAQALRNYKGGPVAEDANQ